jgi:hypothetical protein
MNSTTSALFDDPKKRESISNRGLIRTVLPNQVLGSPFASVFSDFHCGRRNDKPLTSLASPRFEMLSCKGKCALPMPTERSASCLAWLPPTPDLLTLSYKHLDLKNPFAKIEPPLHKEPQIRYLLLADIRRPRPGS